MRGHERERIAANRVRERNAAAGDAHHGERIAADRVRERDRERVAVQRVARGSATALVDDHTFPCPCADKA